MLSEGNIYTRYIILKRRIKGKNAKINSNTKPTPSIYAKYLLSTINKAYAIRILGVINIIYK